MVALEDPEAAVEDASEETGGAKDVLTHPAF